MFRWVFSPHHPQASDSSVSLLNINDKYDDSFFGQRDYVRRVAKGGVDYNDLTPTGKQAALSLAQEKVVKIVERKGRAVVVERGRSPILDFFTIGLAP